MKIKRKMNISLIAVNDRNDFPEKLTSFFSAVIAAIEFIVVVVH